ncbi:MAG: hypothetical protein ACT4QD_11495 [Acidobacteriota bacterium]
MLTLERSLRNRLRDERVQIDVPDDNTAWFRNVPANAEFFNKPTTNLLVKRPDRSLPFVVCVDEDLRYHGDDPGVAQAFAKGHRDRGWRILFVSTAWKPDLQPIVERALKALGFGGRAPSLPPVPPAAKQGPRGGLLESHGVDLTANVEDGSDEPCVGRADAIDGVCRGLLRQRPVLVLITGVSGVGKTSLLHGVARRLREHRRATRIVSVDLGVMLAGTLFGSEREALLASMLREVAPTPELVVALEHLEVALVGAPHTPLLLSEALDRGSRLIGTASAASVARLSAPPLGRRLAVIDLAELALGVVPEVLARHKPRIEAHHGVAIADSLLEVVTDAACAVEGVFPAKALALLDTAAAAAALAGRAVLMPEDLYVVARADPDRPPDGLKPPGHVEW